MTPLESQYVNIILLIDNLSETADGKSLWGGYRHHLPDPKGKADTLDV
jgi:hypothetical protein